MFALRIIEHTIKIKQLFLRRLKQVDKLLAEVGVRSATARELRSILTSRDRVLAAIDKLKAAVIDLNRVEHRIRQLDQEIARLKAKEFPDEELIEKLEREQDKILVDAALLETARDEAEKEIKFHLKFAIDRGKPAQDPVFDNHVIPLLLLKLVIEEVREGVPALESQIQTLQEEKRKLEAEFDLEPVGDKRKNGFVLSAAESASTGHGYRAPGAGPAYRVWADAQYGRISDRQGLRNSRTDSAALSAGIAMLLNDQVVAGLGFSYAANLGNEKGFMRTDSHSFAATPYLLWQVDPSIVFDASLGLFHTGSNTQRGGVNGDFDSFALALNAGVSGLFSFDDAVSVRTRLGYAQLVSWNEGYRESDGTSVSSSRDELGRLSASLRLARVIAGGELFGLVRVDIPTRANELPLETLREAQFAWRAGYAVELSESTALTTEIHSAHTVSGLNSYGGALGLKIKLP